MQKNPSDFLGIKHKDFAGDYLLVLGVQHKMLSKFISANLDKIVGFDRLKCHVQVFRSVNMCAQMEISAFSHPMNFI